jgi:hypothetical protein
MLNLHFALAAGAACSMQQAASVAHDSAAAAAVMMQSPAHTVAKQIDEASP